MQINVNNGEIVITPRINNSDVLYANEKNQKVCVK